MGQTYTSGWVETIVAVRVVYLVKVETSVEAGKVI